MELLLKKLIVLLLVLICKGCEQLRLLLLLLTAYQLAQLEITQLELPLEI